VEDEAFGVEPRETNASAFSERQVHTLSCRFTGTGEEYFRIWIVNLLLTLASFGIYSAWAKVRKAQYFRANTELGGHVFGYHGDPKAILRGRLVALVLVLAYSWGTSFSRTTILVTIAVLSAIGPWLFMRGLQFALCNTSFRGLRFGFRAAPADAYWRLSPLLVLWWTPQLMHGLGLEIAGAMVSSLLPASWPWMHHRLKAYQHGNATYGNLRFEFESGVGSFYGVYAKALGLSFMATVLAIPLVVLRYQNRAVDMNDYSNMGVALVFLLVFFLVVVPYSSARLQQIVWNRTRLSGVSFRMEVKATKLYWLALKNTLLTLLTAGLYWPWAMVALARYQLSCLHVDSERPLALLATAVGAQSVDATGDGALDAFGLDIGL
jgi:uncharacterized membrane protein YjgN (DUF898 family)